MKAIMMTVRLWWFYLTYKGIKKAEIRKRFAKDFKGKIYEYVSKTNWRKDLMKIPAEEREFFKQFVGKVGLCFECNKVEEYVNGAKIVCGQPAHFNTYKFILKDTCLTEDELYDYCEDLSFKAIHITKLEIFDKPKEISEFKHYKKFSEIDYMMPIPKKETCERLVPLTRAPESWCYIEL